MIITWYGHSCFKIQTRPQRGSEEVTIFTDPFDKSIGLKPPQGSADVVLVSHSHHDHSNSAALTGEPFVIDAGGEYSVKEVLIEGILSYHDKEKGALRGLNNIYTIHSEDMIICHLGDLGHILTEDQVAQIGNVDVLMIPIGGKYTLDSKEAEKVIGQIDPKIIIPMHYKIPGLNLDIDDKKAFVEEIGLEVENGIKKFTFKSNDIRDIQNKVIFMNLNN
jgi:L-ascorbate metabolism protein UlaG (beta-lactamase superfamily)